MEHMNLYLLKNNYIFGNGSNSTCKYSVYGTQISRHEKMSIYSKGSN